MKKIIAFVMSLVMLLCATVSGVPVSAGSSVSVNKGFYLEAVPEKSNESTLVYDICLNDTENLGFFQFGLLIDYSDNLELTDCRMLGNIGMFVGSVNYDVKPYCMLWVSGTKPLPYNETHILRLTFDVVSSINSGISFDLEFDPDNRPGGSDGEFDIDDVPVVGEVNYSYSELCKQFPDLPRSTVNIIEKGIYLKPVPKLSSKEVLVYDLCVKDVNNCGIAGFGVYLDYSDELALVSVESLYNQGMFMSGQTVDMRPFPMLWVGGTIALDVNTEIAIARLTFDVMSSLENGVTLGVEIDEENRPSDIDCIPFSNSQVREMGILDFSYDDICNQFPFFESTPGDVNNDGKINIADVSFMLKYIAKWNVEINTDAGDVNDDGKVNIADVSLVLKYIAKWDVVLK